MTKPWMLDELAHAGPEHLDPEFVAGFERKQGFPDPAEDLAVLAAHGLDARSTVVDLGAGTGRFALAAARPSQADAVFGRWLEGAADDPALGYTSADFAEHIRTEHSTFRWLLEPMLAATGFEIVTAEFSGSVYGAYTCRKR